MRARSCSDVVSEHVRKHIVHLAPRRLVHHEQVPVRAALSADAAALEQRVQLGIADDSALARRCVLPTSMCSPSSSSSCAAISAIVCLASPASALSPPIGPLNLPARGGVVSTLMIRGVEEMGRGRVVSMHTCTFGDDGRLDRLGVDVSRMHAPLFPIDRVPAER
jgi:hypothetical protein